MNFKFPSFISGNTLLSVAISGNLKRILKSWHRTTRVLGDRVTVTDAVYVRDRTCTRRTSTAVALRVLVASRELPQDVRVLQRRDVPEGVAEIGVTEDVTRNLSGLGPREARNQVDGSRAER